MSHHLFLNTFFFFEKFNWQIESLFICLSTDERKEQHHEHPCTSYLASPTIVVLPHPRRPVYVNIYNTFPFCQTIQKNFIDMILPNASACISLNRNILWNYNIITPKKINMDLMTSSNLVCVQMKMSLTDFFLNSEFKHYPWHFWLCPLVLPTSPLRIALLSSSALQNTNSFEGLGQLSGLLQLYCPD